MAEDRNPPWLTRDGWTHELPPEVSFPELFVAAFVCGFQLLDIKGKATFNGSVHHKGGGAYAFITVTEVFGHLQGSGAVTLTIAQLDLLAEWIAHIRAEHGV